MWQKCPACDGSGYDCTRFESLPCPVCSGTRIINELTGFPPDYKIETKTTTDIEIQGQK